MNAPERFLAACRRQEVDRTPVWIMRQAGRYLPEYLAVRKTVDFLTLCKSPELAAQVSLQPIERFGMDACIVFSDILLAVEAMGVPVSFDEGGPRLSRTIRSIADVDALSVPDPNSALPFVMDAIRQTKAALDGRAALLGFAGAPFTLASYLVEGGGSKGFSTVKALMFGEPLTFHALLAKLADTIADFVEAQVAAGAQAIQIFDTWAGELDPRSYEQFALPYEAAVVERVQNAGAVAILFLTGAGGLLERMATTKANVLSVDWRVDLADARARLGPTTPLQGNVDPAVLLSNPDAVTRAARAAMQGAGPIGHILNLGHGILPSTPLECAQALVDAPKSVAIARA